MLQVDLSTLSGPELRQLLDSTRDRGQAALSYQVLQEMAARRERRVREGSRGLLKPRRPAEPRMVELNLGDPLERRHEQDVVDDVVLPPDHDPVASLTLARDPDPGPPPRRQRRLGAGFALGIVVGLAAGGALGVGVAEISYSAGMEPPATMAVYSPAPAAPVETPTRSLVVEVDSTHEAPTVAAASPAPETVEVAAADAAAAAQADTLAPPADKQVDAKVEIVPVVDAPVATGKCAAESTPADRAICETPELKRLQRDLRQAYARALDAHEERDVLRQRQLAWRDARNTVTDPERLADLYEQRIRRLNAAAAAAERSR